MVKRILRDGFTFFSCEVCSFTYADKKTAEECESYCKTHKACSTEITKRAVKI